MAGYSYILANSTNERLYKKSTTDLIRHMYEHKHHLNKDSFTDTYNITRLVYYEYYDDIREARDRENQIGKWSRAKKYKLINKMNPKWKDLYFKII